MSILNNRLITLFCFLSFSSANGCPEAEEHDHHDDHHHDAVSDGNTDGSTDGTSFLMLCSTPMGPRMGLSRDADAGTRQRSAATMDYT